MRSQNRQVLYLEDLGVLLFSYLRISEKGPELDTIKAQRRC